MNSEKDNKRIALGRNYYGNPQKLLATGYIIGNTIHAVLNYLTGIRGYVDMILSEKEKIARFREK